MQLTFTTDNSKLDVTLDETRKEREKKERTLGGELDEGLELCGELLVADESTDARVEVNALDRRDTRHTTAPGLGTKHTL